MSEQENSELGHEISLLFAGRSAISVEEARKAIPSLVPNTESYSNQVFNRVLPLLVGGGSKEITEDQFPRIAELISNYANMMSYYETNEIRELNSEQFLMLYRSFDQALSDKQIAGLFDKYASKGTLQIADASFIASCRVMNINLFSNSSSKPKEEGSLDFPWTKEQIHNLFEQFDATNHNGLLSLAEIDKAMTDLWPEIAMHKPALMRAYKTADLSNDGFITEDEFAGLLLYMSYYDKLYGKFSQLDKNNDHRIGLQEFIDGHDILGLGGETAELKQEFEKVDLNRGGFILFDEFCSYMAHKFGRPGKSKNTDLITIPKQKPAKPADNMIKSQPTAKEQTKSPVQRRKKNASDKPLDFPWTKEQIHELFEQFDANNHNGLLSLAEIDKAMMDLWPEIAQHKQALMRAYKTADLSNDGFIEEEEFADLLVYMNYYDKLYEKFEIYDRDGDHRISLAEFISGHEMLGLAADEAKLEQKFNEIDQNGGGFILFDEFCAYMTKAYGRPGKSKKTDLVTIPGQTAPQKAMYKVNAAPALKRTPVDTAAKKVQSNSVSQQPASTHPAQALVEEPHDQTIRNDSIDRRLFKEQNERRRLERVVDSLKFQLQNLGVNGDSLAQNHLAVWDMMQDKNSKLAARLQKEQERNQSLQNSLSELSEKIRQLENEARRDFMEESKRAKSTQITNISKDLRDAKNEKAKFERLYEETTKRLAMESERNRQLQEELALMRQQLGVSGSSRNSTALKTPRKQNAF